MKNVKYFKKEKSSDYIKSLWRTDFFRKEHDKNGFIGLLIKEVTKQPLAFYQFSDEKLEKRHMTPWFNHIAIRESYDEGFEYVQDMYIFHELFHIATLPMTKFDDFNVWMNKMWENELYASLSTEIYIYQWYPELRKDTFSFEIWYDILLERWGSITEEQRQNITTDQVICKDMPELFQKVLDLRIEYRNGRAPENEAEEWFCRYNNYEKWFESWRINYSDIQDARLEIIENNTFENFIDKYLGDDLIPFKDSIIVN